MTLEDLTFYMIFAEIIGSGAVVAVLIATLWEGHKKTSHLAKIDFAKFYDDFDSKLRDTDEKLRGLTGQEDEKIYHYEIKIIVTLTHIIKFYKEEKMKFNITYFQQWIKYGLALTYCFPATKVKKKDGVEVLKNEGDFEYVKTLRGFCDEMNQSWKQGEDWAKKSDSDLPDSILIASGKKP